MERDPPNERHLLAYERMIPAERVHPTDDRHEHIFRRSGAGVELPAGHVRPLSDDRQQLADRGHHPAIPGERGCRG